MIKKTIEEVETVSKQVEEFQKEFLRILEIRSEHVVEALDDNTKTDEQKLQRIQGRLTYDTGHLNNLLLNMEEKMREKERLLDEIKAIESLHFRILRHIYLDPE
ncbi:hypothetical protein [Atopococcus tabaci]|uniref:hypothetical protein n=1 Tax=Atopococcus tabaci TaxID=269774 RepID=UPI00041D26B0|nr:hypothetical protein [Atopococcus tabaci]